MGSSFMQAFHLNNFRHLTVIFLTLIHAYSIAQPLQFRKVNSGTKADILSIKADNQEGVYFLTDKIYALDKDSWKKLDFPAEGKIFTFYPVSAQNIWFTINQVTNTCLLYHYDNGITENIRPPFTNHITTISFLSGDTALFSSIADIATYETGIFRVLHPSPARYVITKIFAKDLSTFWMLTNWGELYLYDQGNYKIMPGPEKVIDFCFSDIHEGFLLSGDELFHMDASGIKVEYKNEDLEHIRRIQLLDNGSIIMVGDSGLVMSYSGGTLTHHEVNTKETLTDVAVTNSGEIWICGEHGRLLYSGKRHFPVYTEDNPGFSSYKLILYGISLDDEYGVAMADFNKDDKTDIYAVRIYEQNRLYINKFATGNKLTSNYGFSEECVKRNAIGVINPGNSNEHSELKLGISVADVDNDNDQDIYLCYLNSVNKLLLNRGDGYFRNVSEQKWRACENMERSNSAAFADVDNDGDLDLFVTNEDGSNRLFENNSTGHFTDITEASGLESTGGGMCASFADVNSDGYPDLCVSFWYPSNKLYLNEPGKGRIFFRDITQLTDLAKAVPAKSNAVAFADVNNDGFTDLFIANRNAPNILYLNDGKGIFKDKTADYFLPENFLSNGAIFADFDLDGYQDLYITNVGENVLYKNMKGSCFTDVTAAFGAELSGYCTGSATGDIDNDGDPDLYVANYINGNSNLFLNNTEKKSFVKFKLHGVRSSKDAIGAKVWLYKVDERPREKALAGYRELNGGSGYGSVSAKEMIFGVEQDVSYYALVKFPSSFDTLRVDNVAAGMTMEVNELTGLAAFYTKSGKILSRFFTDQEKQPEIVKFLLIILLMIFYNLQLRRSTRSIAWFRWLAVVFIFIVFILINRFYLYQWPSAAFFIAPLATLGFMALLDLFIGRILLRRMAQKEKLDLREKLSRDLHDDLASTLGSISIYAETLKGMDQPTQSDFKKLSVKIAGLTQSALQSISDIIWMTSPRNDSLQSLISKTSNYMLEILTDNNINFLAEINIPDEPIILQEKVRNDAFLILKEGLHNIIRHSGAGSVRFRAETRENICSISLKDDGIGMMDSSRIKQGSHGNGLVNMRRRAQESGIDFSIQSAVGGQQSAEGSGVEIILQFKI